jgi:DNA-cytosine methyltransferase
MNILSLFDGISCARVAIEKVGIPITKYYASEIDKNAIAVAMKNYPNTIQLGDVKTITKDLIGSYMGNVEIGLMIGGSPCQDLSIAQKNRKGLDGERSGLFWEYVRILKEVKPKWFILENVASMSKEAKEIITKELGVEPIMINAALVSAQNRKRLFWTNIPNVIQPEDRGIFLKDILESGEADRLKSYCIDANYAKGANWKQYIEKGRRQLIRIGSLNSGGQGDRIYSPRGNNKGGKRALDGKVPTLSSSSWEHNNKLSENEIIRKLTPVECERLQSLPDNYTEGISNTQRYKALGNAFNVEVVAHILKGIAN